MDTWVSYYGADGYFVREPEECFFNLGQNNFSDALGVPARALYEEGFGTNWQEVESIGLDPSFRWFAQGDPWNALISAGRDSLRVSALDLTIGGLAGPGTLTAREPEFVHEKTALTGLLESLKKVRTVMQRRWRRCRDCQSPRLGGECLCHAPVLGIIYD